MTNGEFKRRFKKLVGDISGVESDPGSLTDDQIIAAVNEVLDEEAAKQYGGVDVTTTSAKFEAMLRPLAPKAVRVTDFMRAQGVNVIEVA